MKKQYVVIALILYALTSPTARAQMVGDCIFLHGNRLEIGISPLGSFGSSQSAPSLFHPNGAYTLWDPGASSYVSTRLLGFVADPALDGWTAGAPPMFGDYFLPGTPQEGWSIQVSGVQSNAWTQGLMTGPTTGYSGTLTGNNISHTTSGGVATAIWKGQATSPIKITQTTKLDATKMYFTVNVIIKNEGSAVANNVYYQRTLDPDNEQQQTGSYVTTNKIVHQLPNPDNKVMVTAEGTTYTSAFLGLGTKDCRAKCYILNTGLTPVYSLDQLYAQTTPYYYATGSTYTNDVGMGLVYNLGDILPGDSTSLTFAYVMRASDLDSALNVTSPTFTGNGVLLAAGDTINACLLGIDSIPVTIGNGGGYSWVWMPPTGLTSTTGTSTAVIVDSLTGITTYAVIGTPLSSSLCANDTFYFTVIPGSSAGPGVTPVSYCQYAAAVPLTATGANLLWYTSATGGTGTTTAPTPSTLVAGTYTWWVSQQIGTCPESIRVSVVVTINPEPHTFVGSNSPLCSNQTLLLTATDTFTTGVSYSWSGPLSFTSTLKNPSIFSPTVTASGWYYVTTTVNGCSGVDSTLVVVNPAPELYTVIVNPPSACGLSDGSITLGGMIPAETYTLVYTYNGTTTSTLTIAANGMGRYTITGLHAGLYSGIFVINSYGCASPLIIATLPDGAGPAAPVATSNSPICAGDSLLLFATSSTSGGVYNWAGPVAFTSTLQNPFIYPAATWRSGIYVVTVTNPATGCTSPAGSVMVTINPVPAVPSITGNSPVCAGNSLTMSATTSFSGCTFTWSGPSSYAATGASQTISPAAVTNSGTYTVVASYAGCASAPATYTATVNPIPTVPVALPATYCQYDAAIALTATGGTTWYIAATGGTGSTTPPVPSTSASGTFTWYVSHEALGCESARVPVSVTVNPRPVVSILPDRDFVCQNDTLSLSFSGSASSGAIYSWGLPSGASLVSGSLSAAGPIVARFGSGGSNVVTLTVSAGGCTSSNHYTVHVVPTPVTGLYIAPDICVGDTTTLALTYVSPGITSFAWTTDSTHFHVITSTGSIGGGPFGVSWDSAGLYVIGVTAFSSQEVCPSVTMYDTVVVHALPDASFTHGIATCAGDSVLFTATASSYSYSYTWSPSAYFASVSGPSVYGAILTSGDVSLTVTDPFGCSAIESVYIPVSGCCRMTFPDAFTPNGDGRNDHFRPITDGHHRMETFRVVNRWGTTVYETTNSDSRGWDGTLHGVPQDMGVYFWFLKMTCDGNSQEQKGTVTLVR
ncbi:MAG: gliding motility-associated C-terminal domain-containing protein [Bacteroidota bacterium]